MRIRIALLVWMSFLLAACASTPETASDSRATIRDDVDYIEHVERAARRRGVTVRWVNPPRAETARSAQGD